jgi:hypothetical protein
VSWPLDPRQVAAFAVDEMIAEGLKKHADEAWRTQSASMHIDKAIRHVITHRLIKDGHQPPDGETHLMNAITRLAMALTQELQGR